MITTRLQSAGRLLLVAMALAAVTLSVGAARPAHAAGLRNCVDVPAPQSGRAGCWELV